MANTEFNVRIQLKRDTDANWRAKDPQLLAGEVVFVDTNAGEVRTKVGDGTKKYSALPFMDEALRNLISASEHLFKVRAVCDLVGDLTTPTLIEHGDINDIFEVAINTTQPIVAQIYAQDDENAEFLWPLVGFNTDTQKAVFMGTSAANVWWQLVCHQGTWSCKRIELAELTDIPTKLSQLENDTNYLNSDTNFVHKTGDEEIKGIKTFESSIVCSMTPGNENHLVNKKYVDNKVGTYLPLAGGKMTGNILMNNKEITQAAKIGFLRGAYFESSNIQQQNVISAFTSDGSTLAYLNAYAHTPKNDDNAMVLANKEYVDKKTTVLLKTWTSADVS